MIPNPIHKVLSTMQDFQVKCLLMGGQACVLHGAAEFRRNTDFALMAGDEEKVVLGLAQEEMICPDIDRRYWLPLKKE